MGRGRAMAMLVAAVAISAGQAGIAHAAGKGKGDRAAQRACIQPQSWVAGTVNLCRGTIVYNDYVFDDHGADTGAPLTNRIGNLSPVAGDQTYAAGQEGTADLIRLSLKPRGKQLQVSAQLAGLFPDSQTTLAIAIDADNDRRTGGGRWGDLDVSSSGWDRIAYLTNADPTKNRIRGRIKMPLTKRWRVQAVVASAGGQVMNVAFRGPNERSGFGENALNAATGGSAVGAWFEDKQAKALASGDISEFGKTITGRNLKWFRKHRKTRIGGSRVTSGFHERVYRSDYTIGKGEGYSYDGIPGRGDGGDGVSLGFEQKFNFLGRFQPYGIYLPKSTAGKPGTGMQMLFHGSGANLASLVGQPGMQQRFGEEQNRILVTPEGRGTEGWASDISERDLLDVIADVEKAYDVDQGKVLAGGYSQGGYATYRMASLHPDLFAGAVDWVGFTGSSANGNPLGAPGYTAGAVGNAVDFIQNLLHVPTVMLYSGADELVQVNQAVAIDQAFAATDNVYRYYLHPAAEHLTYAGLDDWRKEAAYTHGMTLDPNPARVLFTTAPFLDAPQYGIVHDHAYWVSKLRTSGGPKDYGTVDLTSAGCGGQTPKLASSSGTGIDPVPWVSDDQHVSSEEPIAKVPRLAGTLTGVSSLEVDADRSCLAGQPIEYEITSDGPATISFSDGRTLRIGGPGTARGTLAN